MNDDYFDLLLTKQDMTTVNIILFIFIIATIYVIFYNLYVYSQLLKLSGKFIKVDNEYTINKNTESKIELNPDTNVTNDTNEKNNNAEGFDNYLHEYNIKEFIKLGEDIEYINYFYNIYYLSMMAIIILISIINFSHSVFGVLFGYYNLVYKIIIITIILYIFSVYIETNFYFNNSFNIIKRNSNIINYDNNKFIIIPNISNNSIFNYNISILLVLVFMIVCLYIEITNRE